jgi:hypothetical protein
MFTIHWRALALDDLNFFSSVFMRAIDIPTSLF